HRYEYKIGRHSSSSPRINYVDVDKIAPTNSARIGYGMTACIEPTKEFVIGFFGGSGGVSINVAWLVADGFQVSAAYLNMPKVRRHTWRSFLMLRTFAFKYVAS